MAPYKYSGDELCQNRRGMRHLHRNGDDALGAGVVQAEAEVVGGIGAPREPDREEHRAVVLPARGDDAVLVLGHRQGWGWGGRMAGKVHFHLSNRNARA